MKLALTTLPVASTSFREDAEFSTLGGEAQLTFEFRRNGIWVRGGLAFNGVSAYRHRAESNCTVWHVEGVYDTLVDVQGSKWVAELNAAFDAHFSSPGVVRADLHHYMIYVDSVGSFEIAANSWSWLPEEPAA